MSVEKIICDLILRDVIQSTHKLRPYHLHLMITVALLALLTLHSTAADLEGSKAAACVQLANDWVTMDAAIAEEVREAKGQAGLTLKQVLADILVYCFNHITHETATAVLAKEVTHKHESVQALRRYRKGEQDASDIPQKQQENSRRVLDAALRWNKLHGKKSEL